MAEYLTMLRLHYDREDEVRVQRILSSNRTFHSLNPSILPSNAERCERIIAVITASWNLQEASNKAVSALRAILSEVHSLNMDMELEITLIHETWELTAESA